MDHSGGSRRTRVGLVGAGAVSGEHLRALGALSAVEVVGICDVDREKAGAVARRFNLDAAFGSLDELAVVQPDVVHIVTPPETHCALTLRALEMGWDVFVEKPMAESVAECDAMIRAAAERGRMLSVDHSARFDPAKALVGTREGLRRTFGAQAAAEETTSALRAA